ncbi:hypothetical protein D7Z26_24980 [Cohnella endophytica]|uniref:Type II secretion system protein GspF domain-containing protein n=1 Tax=Cohnella endophytica TaxID=2419778 RepID=A0A494X541_9BACL|nr:hypothetical protein [Cohnella endophytica]RKP45808.1 hypothetical protein D7Z26_24980 [Cohnella endophytica]
MAFYVQSLMAGIGGFIQFVLSFVGIFLVLRLVYAPRNRWLIQLRGWRERGTPRWWLKIWRTDAMSVGLQERRMLLSGCGIRYPPESYLAYRRCALFVFPFLGGGAYVGMNWGLLKATVGWNAILAFLILCILAASDRYWLQSIRRYRTDRIRREIVAVSSQLLYYTGSRLHLHGKLMKCLALTRHIRGEMGLLLNEWYHDADAALRRFKERLGTDEAYGFAESMRSLRLNESEEIYAMLREIVRDYKAQIELAKDSRKETTSYLLFVLAGIPILYTFQIFLYPWVQEAAKLFDALNP